MVKPFLRNQSALIGIPKERIPETIAAVLDVGALFAVCLLIFFSPLNKFITRACFYSALFLWICANLINHRREFLRKIIPVTALNTALIIFLGSALIAVFFSRTPEISRQIFFERYLLYILTFWITYHVTSRLERSFSSIAVTISLLSIFLGIGALRDYFLFRPERLFSVFSIPVDLAFPVVLFMPFCFAILVGKTQKGVKYPASLALLVLLPILLFNGSRGALIAIALSMLTIFISIKRKYKFIFVAAIIVSVAFLPKMYKARVATIPDMLNQPSVRERINLFASAIDITRKYPLFGAGPGMYEQLNSSKIHLHAHNMYLETAAEMGIVGLIAFLIIPLVFLREFVRIWREWLNSGCRKYTIQLAAGLAVISVLVFNLSISSILVGIQDALVFWCLLAVSLSVDAPRKPITEETLGS